MTAVLKQVNPQFGAEAVLREDEAPAAGAAAATSPASSPAKALQDTLSKQLEGVDTVDKEMSARFVTFIVIGACALTWVGGVLLYATL